MANGGSGAKSTQKLPKHDSYASQTEDSTRGPSSTPYKDGDKKGHGGSKSDPDGAAPAAGRTKYTSND